MSDSGELNRRIANSYNQYFTWNNNTAFYVLSPAYLFQFYNISVRTWDEWNNGWVEGFHSEAKGILATQFAGSLCRKIADLIYGDGILYENSEEKNEDNDNLQFVSDLNNAISLSLAFKDSILKSSQLGNSLLKLNFDNESGVWIDAIAGNRFFVSLSSSGKIAKCRSYVNLFTAGVPGTTKPDSYGLVEERYYEKNEDGDYKTDKLGRKIPIIEYKIYKLLAPANVFSAPAERYSIPFNDLPRQVRMAFIDEYGTELKLDKPTRIEGIDDSLGVYLVKHTRYLNAMPNIKLGESCLASILNYLPQYDAINSEEVIDLRLSRPKIAVPEFMGKPKNSNSDPLEGYDEVIFNKVPSKSDKDQSLLAFIPTPREEHFIRMKEDVIKKVCGNLGVATSSLFSDIADARGSVTAREIDSETSNTALYITNKRQIVLEPFNECLKDIMKFFKKEPNVKVAFSPVGSSNKMATTDNITKLKGAELVSEYEAIKELHPDWSYLQIKEELDEIHKTDGTKSSDESNTKDNSVDNKKSEGKPNKDDNNRNKGKQEGNSANKKA